MIDIMAPSTVSIEIRDDAKVVWVNIDGVCELRVCGVKKIVSVLTPDREQQIYRIQKALKGGQVVETKEDSPLDKAP